MFGSTMPLNGIRFRQDNDFYYLTGNADVNAVLVMDAATGRRVAVPARTGRPRNPYWTERTGSRRATRRRPGDSPASSR